MLPTSSKISFCLDRLIENLSQCKLPSESDVQTLCKKAMEIFSEESNVQLVPAPVTICGRVYGFFDNLLEIFRVGGSVPDTNYLFVGQFLDKGQYKVQVVSLLLALKIKHPKRITIVRGPDSGIWNVHGLAHECENKYGNEYLSVWKAFAEMFQYLPLSAVVEGQIFCVSGGLSLTLNTLDDIRQLDRIQEMPDDGPLTDLMWSNPSEEPGWGLSPTGAGFAFGPDITEAFNYMNGLNLIVRAQFTMQGYEELQDGQLINLYSAPDAWFSKGYPGALMEVNENVGISYRKFYDVPRLKTDKDQWRVPNFFLNRNYYTE